MANHKDALKRIRQNTKRRARNRHYRTMMRNQVKKLHALIETGDKEAVDAQLSKAVSMVQRVSGKGIIHNRQAARRVSRLAHAVKRMEAASSES
ncbi:MAG: 30S ribosomal protein S20 [Deltaproteobacteria bacterium]|nr:30S ribosomal protein S20 [Deltaproteobacteria bacterium]HCH66833.1 30S ribosomal protein S20 [Deltaproteobacteria bacterium]